MIQRSAIFPANRHALDAVHGYSAAIRSGDGLCVSGQVGSGSDSSPNPNPNFEAQVRLAFSNLAATLTAAGCSFGDIVAVISFHAEPETQLPTIMQGKAEILPSAPDRNWTGLGVTWRASFEVEIKLTARIPD
jgi:enamine deaminase RidA (YjgF/YER057c/UK114 family)